MNNILPQSKVIPFVCFLFAVGSILMLFLAVKSTRTYIQFVKIGILAEGTVTEMTPVTWRDGEGDIHQGYSPTISYITQEGKQLFYYPNSKSYPPKYTVGETVILRYRPNYPMSVEIKGEGLGYNLIIWLFALGFGGVGFGGTGYYIRKAMMQRWLKKYGVNIQSDFVEVAQPNITINGRRPYVIHSKAENPTDKQSYRFTSEYFFADPTSNIQPKQSIPVLVDPKNWKRYTMDTSFLHQE